jgi:small membrane protein
MLIQILLLVGIALVAATLLRRAGARHQAIRRLALVAFGAFAVTSVIFPDIWNALARIVGVGRGADLLFYGTIMVLLGYMATSYVRFRELEHRFTTLARRIALDEVPAPGASSGPAARPVLPGAPDEIDRAVGM